MKIQTLASSSKGNCYKISDGDTSLLIECGISISEIKRGLNFKLLSVDACLVSHEHKDHSKSICDVVKCGIPVYTSKEVLTHHGLTDHHRTHYMKSKEKYFIGSFVVVPFELEHDVHNFGFVIYSNTTKEKLLFATDTFIIKYRIEGLTHIMVECNYSKETLDDNIRNGYVDLLQKPRLLLSHFSLENVVTFLKSNDLRKVEEIHLLHLSDRNSDEKLFKETIQAVTGKLVYIAGGKQ